MAEIAKLAKLYFSAASKPPIQARPLIGIRILKNVTRMVTFPSRSFPVPNEALGV